MEKMGDQKGHGKALVCLNLSNCYEALGQYDKAIGLLEEAQVIVQEVGNRASEAKVLTALGKCKAAQGEY